MQPHYVRGTGVSCNESTPQFWEPEERGRSSWLEEVDGANSLPTEEGRRSAPRERERSEEPGSLSSPHPRRARSPDLTRSDPVVAAPPVRT